MFPRFAPQRSTTPTATVDAIHAAFGAATNLGMRLRLQFTAGLLNLVAMGCNSRDFHLATCGRKRWWDTRPLPWFATLRINGHELEIGKSKKYGHKMCHEDPCATSSKLTFHLAHCWVFGLVSLQSLTQRNILHLQSKRTKIGSGNGGDNVDDPPDPLDILILVGLSFPNSTQAMLWLNILQVFLTLPCAAADLGLMFLHDGISPWPPPTAPKSALHRSLAVALGQRKMPLDPGSLCVYIDM